MYRPCKFCDEETFRVLHKLCARLTRKMPYALYLAVLHSRSIDNAEAQCLHLLSGGEVCCRMPDGRLYILLFARTDEGAECTLSPVLAALPGSTVRISRVTQRLREDPTDYEE